MILSSVRAQVLERCGIDLPKFTLVGATNTGGALAAPLRDRFGIINRLEYYKQPELEFIVTRAAEIPILVLSRLGLAKLHDVQGGRRVSQIVYLNGYVILHKSLVMGLSLKTLQMMRYKRLYIDKEGPDRIDRRVLECIIEKYDGGPVGIDTIAAAISEERDTIEDVYEPYLMQSRILGRTPRGRVVTKLPMSI